MLAGSFVAIVTPFKNGKIDETAFKQLIEFHARSGTDWIVPCGTTGESPTLNHDEHNQVVDMAIKYSAGRMKICAGAGSNSTDEAISLSNHAEQMGAHAVLSITPYYNKPTQDGMYAHFKAIADAVSIPVILYNVPGRTGVNLEMDTIIKLAKIPNIRAIKEASGNLEKVSEIVLNTDLAVLSGEDSLNYPILSLGGKGVISVTANIVPDLVSQMVHSTLKQNHVEARKLHDRLFYLSKKLFLESNPIPVKAALSAMGKIENEVRLPLLPMSESKQAILLDELRKLELVS